jgi:hypothetical protein
MINNLASVWATNSPNTLTTFCSRRKVFAKSAEAENMSPETGRVPNITSSVVVIRKIAPISSVNDNLQGKKTKKKKQIIFSQYLDRTIS